ncbi:MAG: DUF5615 family PIN-like protein [Phycisphaeraceae bacterium]
MSAIRFLLDHDFNAKIMKGVLRIEPTVDFVRVRDVGLAEASDNDVLAYAANESLITLSHDVNTMRYAAYKRLANEEPMAGLLLAVQEKPLKPIIDELVYIWSASQAYEWAGRVQYIPL